jgi:hypothetical protein
MSHAVVALPVDSAQLPTHRRWLARTRLERGAPGELLPRVLSALGVTPPAGGSGALRLWGQTGKRPAGWVAAADPVYLEARLDHLFLHALPASELPEADVREIFGYLQNVLAVGGSAFASVGRLGYLHCGQPMMTAKVSPAVAQGDAPGDYMPAGVQAKAHDRLQSEVQMCLYESAVNERRAQAGLRPINGLWLWGGGVAGPFSPSALPPLYADDPLMTGYWFSSGAPAAPWPGDIEACLGASPGGFVAVVPEECGFDLTATHEAPLSVLRRMLQRGRLRSMTLLFRDGLRADVGRWDALRWWRHSTVLPEPDRR